MGVAGKLALTEEGIRARDRLVISSVRDSGAPLVIVPAGGYAATPGRTAELHMHVFRETAAHQRAASADQRPASGSRPFSTREGSPDDGEDPALLMPRQYAPAYGMVGNSRDQHESPRGEIDEQIPGGLRQRKE
jgi:hypothetical protein